MRVLVLNPGSSTLKASLVTVGADAGRLETIEWPAGRDDPPDSAVATLRELGSRADAVGYRVVHGGSAFRGPTRVDAALLATVEALDVLAPLHNHRAAVVMRAGLDVLPGLPHVACFDTAFHASLPEAAWRYPLPEDWVDRIGARRFGFHGLSVAWATRRASELLERPVAELRLVVAHLGSGCSVTAVDAGVSVQTSMGLTPYEGLMMGTRAGSVDPGLLVRLLDEGVGADALAEGMAERSGLLAIGRTPDVRRLEERATGGDARARLALDMFAARAAAGVAAVATAMPRMDALVFTGGIGEHSASVRSDIVRRLAVLGLPGDLDDARPDAVIGSGPVVVLVVEAREDQVIAGEVAELLERG